MWDRFLDWAIPTVSGGMLSATVFYCRKFSGLLKEFKKTVEDSKSTDKVVLKRSISETHKKSMKEGEIDRYTLEIVEEEFKRYEELGGNSFIHKMMDDIRTLKII